MSLTSAFTSALRFGVVGLGVGVLAGVLHSTISGNNDDANVKKRYPESLRNAKRLLEHDEGHMSMVELSHLRFHAPEKYDDLITNLERMLNAEVKSKENLKLLDRKAVIKWRMVAKRASDNAIQLTREIRAIVETEHPAALESFDTSAACVTEMVNASLHNVLMDSAESLA